MNRPLFTLVVALTALAGCSTNSIYQDQPLVAKVDTGMTQEQVRQIGGPPLAVSDRTVEPGTCFDYKLTHADHQQPYNVSFDGRGMVDHTSFMTCAEWSHTQLKAREPSRPSGGGGY
ncbi:osmotically-inducible lipoprotein OsmE [Pseudomonas sp. P5_109]|uniref:osmotically-inducible lipoprotein OsmE n=1 Tax=unclassified Pseudomonas TaxID=196821 RepID=UPI001CC0A369|nr:MULTISPECIES: osmotically-inducible lipoprotein OsmE [unclassified Pseudomonas]WPN32459.1 osmotically-inducible lipoprotein OsmE [Pseudomonas sp. P5_109]